MRERIHSMAESLSAKRFVKGRAAAVYVPGKLAPVTTTFGLGRGSLATLLHAPQPLSCAPQAPRTPPPSLPLQRNALAPWLLLPSSLIHRKGRRPARLLYSRPEGCGGRDAGVSGWDGSRGASPSLELKGSARRRRPGL